VPTGARSRYLFAFRVASQVLLEGLGERNLGQWSQVSFRMVFRFWDCSVV
jgi:hypothetical protein